MGRPLCNNKFIYMNFIICIRRAWRATQMHDRSVALDRGRSGWICFGFASPRRGPYIPPMFGDFLNRLTQPEPAPLPDADARLALTALLVRIARSDHEYAADERDQIDRIAADRYGLAPAQAADLRARAEQLESEAPDTVRFTRAIKDAVAYDDRRAVVGAMWRVVLADGLRTDEENALMRLAANLLGVSDRDSAIERQKAGRG